jgi:16S rRNA (guanine527-N7)-methyltransferase
LTVSRETVAGLVRRHSLGAGAADQLDLLLSALEAEPDPPTTARRREDAIRTHVADSLTGLEVADLHSASRIADIGAGAGFPGLVLAVALPGAKVDLIESAGRKTAVIDRLLQAAKLDNARSVTARAEDWAKAPPPMGGRDSYDVVTARALDRLVVLAEYASPLLRADGVLVAWKGARDDREESDAAAAAEELGMRLEATRPVEPFAGAEHRHLLVMRKVAATPAGLPRRAGIARKRRFRGRIQRFGPEPGGSDRDEG